MRGPDRKVFLEATLAAALGIATVACGGPVVETPKPYHIVPCPSDFKPPWEGGTVQKQKLAAVEPVIVFDSMIKPQPLKTPNRSECFGNGPIPGLNATPTANPSRR